MPRAIADRRRPLTTDRPAAALGLVAGPLAFVAAWAVGGARTPGYSPIDQAISRIAEVGAPEQATMTAGFVAYGGAVLVGSLALRGSPLARCWPFAAVNGAATIAVAATPLERSELVDALHSVAAATGYLSITALPLVAAPILADLGHRRAAAASVAVGAVAGAALVATNLTEANGLFQRIGLTAGDAWLAAVGAALWSASRRAAPATGRR